MKAHAIAVAAALLLTGCQQTASGPAAATDIRAACGAIRTWTPAFQQLLAAELRRLPPDHPIWQLARDAIAARDAVRICRQEGVPQPVIEAIAAEIRAHAPRGER